MRQTCLSNLGYSYPSNHRVAETNYNSTVQVTCNYLRRATKKVTYSFFFQLRVWFGIQFLLAFWKTNLLELGPWTMGFGMAHPMKFAWPIKRLWDQPSSHPIHRSISKVPKIGRFYSLIQVDSHRIMTWDLKWHNGNIWMIYPLVN